MFWNKDKPKEEPQPSTPYDCLKDEIDGYIKYSYTWMRVWALIYYVLRTSLIVLAALVAAKDSLPAIKNNLAILALLVAVGTSLDTWLKTGDRYRGHYAFNDKFIALHTDLLVSESTDRAKLDSVTEQFKKLIYDYAAAVLPT
ncbi:MAG TPA: hypothetical protein VKU19_28300 [Bryobacteraceae bacterium]|nr:hypothetical protein [Bryobacteraceae bacterium]